MSAIVYDAGVLVGADRNDRHVWEEHRAHLLADVLPLVPSTVVAQVSRSPRQVQLRRFLSACEIVAFDTEAAHRVGALLAKARQKNVVDASVVDLARARGAAILTSDPGDLRRLVAVCDAEIAILEL